MQQAAVTTSRVEIQSPTPLASSLLLHAKSKNPREDPSRIRYNFMRVFRGFACDLTFAFSLGVHARTAHQRPGVREFFISVTLLPLLEAA